MTTIKVLYTATNPRLTATLEAPEEMLAHLTDILRHGAKLMLAAEFANDTRIGLPVHNIESTAKLVALSITAVPALPVEPGRVTITDELRTQLLQAAMHHRKASYFELGASREVMSPERACAHNALWHEHRAFAEMLEALAAGETPKSIKVAADKDRNV